MTPAGAAWSRAAQVLEPLFDGVIFELRFSLQGHAAVRVLAPRGPVAPRHAEPPEPPAPWVAQARCGDAVGWLLANAAPADGQRASDLLERAVERHAALALQMLTAQRSAMAADLLERLTHQLRTDVTALQAVAEGALEGVFDAGELPRIPGEVRAIGQQAQRRLSSAREVMTALSPAAPPQSEPVVETLRAELAGAGVAVPVAGVEGERPMTLIGRPGWAGCARLLAEALARDHRLGGPGAAVAVLAHPAGWQVIAGHTDHVAHHPGSGPGGPASTADHRHPAVQRVAWTAQALGELVHAGHIVAAAGGSASNVRLDNDRLGVELMLPAAPSM